MQILPHLLQGNVTIPPSKSMAHRAIICASLSKGESDIINIDYSDDILATINAMEQLGAIIIKNGSHLKITGITSFSNEVRTIDCKESGSTLRFLIPLTLLQSGKTNFHREGHLKNRPLSPYYNIFDKQNINYSELGEILSIEGKLQAGEFVIKGDISSQFISGLLFALPLLANDSKIIIEGELESRDYIAMTIQVLAIFGITIKNNKFQEFIISGNQEYQAQSYTVEADYSQSAFFFVAGALGSDIQLLGLNKNSCQGDKEIIDILQAMNITITHQEGLSANHKRGQGITIDARSCPDIIPVLTVLAALNKGTTHIINASRLRIKECDRLRAIRTELNKIGAKIEEREDSLIIEGVEEFTGGNVSTWDDHRIAMSLAIASTRCTKPIIIDNPFCVKKSFPHFWEVFQALGGKIQEET